MEPESFDASLDPQELVAVVAHDLRNPLACIEGYAEFMMSRDLPAAERAKLLARILSCSRFMEQVIGDLLDLSAIEGGGFAVRKTQVRLSEVLAAAAESLAHSAESRGAALEVRGAPSAHWVQADPARIQQIVQNLVSNALKHVAQGTGRVEIVLHEFHDEFIIEVSDNGTGIDAANLDRLFDKFFRADPESKGSLGLGLFIARALVEAHDGRIWARSEGPGKGAQFFFSLPKFDPERAFAEYKAARGVPTPPPRKLRR
ncbi:MAG: HAMP domain-containing histidine kinase [Elusimicrobia bacterium]|nr:HAMP domain-containing histidine kinase [Elusimicrobiota bacterium]